MVGIKQVKPAGCPSKEAWGNDYSYESYGKNLSLLFKPLLNDSSMVANSEMGQKEATCL